MTAVQKEFSCLFNGGCGSNFTSETDYLRHIVKHLRIRGTTASEIVDGFREQSKNLTQDQYAFDCLIPRQILALYNRENEFQALADFVVTADLEENNDDLQLLQPSTSNLCTKSPITQAPSYSSFPVYELVLNRFQAEQDELIPRRHSAISLNRKDKQLPNVYSIVPKGTEFPKPVAPPPKIQWNEILENFPSVIDAMEAKEIIKAATEVEAHTRTEVEQNQIPQLRDNYFFFDESTLQQKDIVSVPVKALVISDDEQRDENFESRTIEGTSFDKEEQRPLKRGGKDMRRLCLALTPVKSCLGSSYPQPRPNGALKVHNSQVFSKSIPKADNSRKNSLGGKSSLAGRLLLNAQLDTVQMHNSIRVPRCKTLKRKLLPMTSESEYYSSDYILEEGLKKKRAVGVTYLKPYVCPVPKCGKSYKNANGIKYHAKYGHSPPQEFPCHCGKLYSSMHSLLAHKKTHTSSGCSPRSTSDNSVSTSDSDVSDCSDDCSRESCCERFRI